MATIGSCIRVRWELPSAAASPRSATRSCGTLTGAAGRRPAGPWAPGWTPPGRGAQPQLGHPLDLPAARGPRRGPPGRRAGFGGVYVDANAVSVATAQQVAAVVTAGGASYVDGGIIGPPPDSSGGHTRLYLSGKRAAEVQALFRRSALDARIAEGPLYAASATKMAYAAWTKGTSALLLACRALARAEGVERTLLAEWALSQPRLAEQSEQAAQSAALKGWRWVGEMDEIAAAMADAGLPTGFHEAAADVYDRSPNGAGTLDTVLSALL